MAIFQKTFNQLANGRKKMIAVLCLIAGFTLAFFTGIYAKGQIYQLEQQYHKKQPVTEAPIQVEEQPLNGEKVRR